MTLGTPGTTPNSVLNANAFAKCAPAISTNIRQCGTVTAMNAAVPTVDELDNLFQKNNDFRVMEALFDHDLEIKMCEATQNGLYDFFMAQKIPVTNRISSKRLGTGLVEIAPFIMQRQFSPINNEYWKVTNGTLTGGNPAGSLWSVRASSTTNIPADVNSFPDGLRVFIQGKSTAGAATRTAWRVISSVLAADGSYVTLYLASENFGSNLLAEMGDKLGHPVTGLMQRGTPNINDYEKWCSEAPSYNNIKMVPAWVETTRNSLCKSSVYDQWKELILMDNPLYKTFFNLPDADRNRQIGADFQRRMVNQMMWGKPKQYQTQSSYDNLEQIPVYDASAYGFGADGGAVIGRRANAVGIYEQLAECNRVVDALGQQLNLPALFAELYNMMRIKTSNGSPAPDVFDIFTDSVTAELINQAMILYYKDKSGNQLQYIAQAEGQPKKAEFGFKYRSYTLFWPAVTINVLTHFYFDDWRTAAQTALGTNDNTSRVLWILDMPGIYPGILNTERVVNETGNLKTLAAANPDFACVMKVPTKEQTLTSITWAMIVECPASSLIIENFSGAVPEYKTLSGSYPGSNTTTTSSTAFAG